MKIKMLILFFALQAHVLMHASNESDTEVQSREYPIDELGHEIQIQIAKIQLDKLHSQEEIDIDKEKLDAFEYIITFRDQIRAAGQDSEKVAQLKEEKSELADQKFQQIIKNEIKTDPSIQWLAQMQTQGCIRAFEQKRDIFEYSHALTNIKYNYKHASSIEEQRTCLEAYVQLDQNKPNIDEFMELVMQETHNSMRQIIG